MTTPHLRHISWLACFCAAGLLFLIGCQQEFTAPTMADRSTPTLAATTSTALSFREVSAGSEHACGVTTDDRAYCWGSARFGQLGNGMSEGPEHCGADWSCSTRPAAVVGGLRFLQVTSGAQHTCGITTGNKLYCWGYNLIGQSGFFGADSSETPRAVETTRRFRQVSAGQDHTCAITLTNLAFCWGSNQEGNLGDGTNAGFRIVPSPVAGGLHWIQLSAGRGHTCGVTTTNRVYCWGNNFGGALGNGSTTSHNVPVAISGGIQFLQVDAGFDFTCAVNIGHRAYCWGQNGSAQLGDGTRTTRLTPTPLADTRRYEEVSAGADHTCSVSQTSKGVCWGAGGWGQLGNGTTFRRSPTPVSGGLLFEQMTAGFGYSCGITTSSRAYCWGDNFFGNLGDGTTERHLVPVAVSGP